MLWRAIRKLYYLTKYPAVCPEKKFGERMKLMKKLADQGITIIVIEHIMMFIKEICDRVVVLHAGELIAQGTLAREVIADPKVIDAYLGGGKI